MLLPKRVKHRKQHRGRMTGRAMRGNKIAHGDYGLVIRSIMVNSDLLQPNRVGSVPTRSKQLVLL